MPYVNDTGLPSVTEIISPYIDKEWFTEESRMRGEAVHRACQSHLLSLYVVPLPPCWQGYYDSFRRWADLAIDSIQLVEKRLSYNATGLKFCGQLDTILTLKGDSTATQIDWKTSLTHQNWWKLQSAAYRFLAESCNYPTHRGLSIRLKNDGSGGLINEYPRNYSKDFNIFVSLYNAYQFFKGKGG